MNQIKKCSIAGVSFTFEIDAYQTLSDYIDSLKQAYSNDPDGKEIIADIEARIAELILSVQPIDAIVCKSLVCNIIKQMGSAEQIDNEQSDNASTTLAETTDLNGNPRIPRRLYRDLQNRKLGGVCSGLANYFDVDPTWIRLVFAVPIVIAILIRIFGGLHITLPNISLLVGLSYLIMWFTIPAASSARQRLEMEGKRVTANNIRQATQAPDEPERTILSNIVLLLGKILLIMLKICAALIIIGLVIGVSVLGLVAICALPMLAFDLTTGLALVGFFLVIILPLCVLIYLTIALLISQRPNGKAILLTFLLWLASLTMMTITAIKSSADFADTIENAFDSVFEHDGDILFEEFSREEINAYRIQIGQEPLSNVNVTTSTNWSLGDNVVSTHYNTGMQITFCGTPEVIEFVKKSIEMDTDKGEVRFKTASGQRPTITQRGIEGSRVGFDIEREALGTEYSEYAFTTPDGLKVHCLIGPAVKSDVITREALEAIFGTTGAVFNIAGGILNIAKNILSFTGNAIVNNNIVEAQNEIFQAQEDILKAQEETREAMFEAQTEARKAMQDAQKAMQEARENMKEARENMKKIGGGGLTYPMKENLKIKA